MVGWRSGGAQISRAGPSASSQLFTKHFGHRGPEDRGGWSSYGEPSPSDIGSQLGSSYSPSQFTQPTLSTLVSGRQSPPLTRGGRGVFMDGPVFGNKYSSAQPRPPKYAVSKLDTIRAPRENGHQNGHSNGHAPLIIKNGYAKPRSPIGRKKRKAPAPPTPYPMIPPADYDGYDCPPVPPKPPSILSSSSSSSGSIRKKVSYKDEPEYIERTDHEKAFAEFKDELMKSADQRSKKGNVEPPERAKAPVEDSLNAELKQEIVRAAEERARRPFIEPVLKTGALGHIKDDTVKESRPSLSDALQEELRSEFGKYFDRRKSGSLRMRKNDKNRVLYTALSATSIGNAVRKDDTKDWVPEQDLVDDVLDGPVTIQQHTDRNAAMPTFFPVFQDNISEMESISGYYRKGPGSKSSRNSRQGSGKKGKFKSQVKNAWGSLRRSFGRKNKLKDILNDPQWEIYHAENYDPAPQGPISIHHIETKPAYAYNPHKGQLMLIPNFDKVIVTPDGKHIREDTLTKVAKLGSEKVEPVTDLNPDGMTPTEVKREIERRQQLRAEMQFQIVRRQVSSNSDDVFRNGPMKPPSVRDDYSSLDRLIRQRDKAMRTNPIYDSDEDGPESSESTESPEEKRSKKRNSKRESNGYVPYGMQPAMFPPNGMPQMIPVAMYPGMQAQPQMIPYMMPQWTMPPQQPPPPPPAPVYPQPQTYTAFAPPQRPARPESDISVGDKSTLINISYEPQPVTSPLTSNTSLSSPPTSPIPNFRPVKFQPKPPEPATPAPPPPPPPPPPQPELPVEPPKSPSPPPVSSPMEFTIPKPVSPYTPSGRTSPYTFPQTTLTTTETDTKKDQVVADKEMPTFYRRDFYRKLLTGPVGWKPVSFQAGNSASKERYLVDTDFDTNQTPQTQPRDIKLSTDLTPKPSASDSVTTPTTPNPPTPSTPPPATPDDDLNDALKREIIKEAERRSSKPYVEPVFTKIFDPNNNEAPENNNNEAPENNDVPDTSEIIAGNSET